MVPLKWDIHAPLYKWSIVGNYHSADQCFTDKAGFVGRAELRAIERAGCPVLTIPMTRLSIGSDDPRLKER